MLGSIVAFLGTLTLLCKRQQAPVPASPSSSSSMVVYVSQPPSTGRAVDNPVYGQPGGSTDGRSATGYIEQSDDNTAGYLDVGGHHP